MIPQNKIIVMIIGANSSGKTCLRKALAKQQFTQIHEATIGIYFSKIQLKYNDETYQIYLWEAAGGYKFMEIVQNNYFPLTQIFIFVYDICQIYTFDYLKTYIPSNIMKNQSIGYCYGIVLGNKCDKDKDREVSYEEGLLLGGLVGGFEQVSAKCGKNIPNFLQQILVRKLSKHPSMIA